MLDAFFRVLGYGLCHQLADRSFSAGGYQLPVCARDTGIYLGFALGLVALWALERGRRSTELPSWPVLALIGAFIAAMAYDGVTSYVGLRGTTNDIRLATGLVTGWGLAALTVPMINGQLWARAGRGRVLEGPREVAIWLVALVTTFVAVRWLMPASGVFYPIAVSVSIIATFVSVNLVIVALVPDFERKVLRMRDAWRQLGLAVLLTAFELGAASWIRIMAERIL